MQLALRTAVLALAAWSASCLDDDFREMPKCPGAQDPKRDASNRLVPCLPSSEQSTAQCGDDYRCWFNGFNFLCCPFGKAAAAAPPQEQANPIIPLLNLHTPPPPKVDNWPLDQVEESTTICPNSKRPVVNPNGRPAFWLPQLNNCQEGSSCWFTGLNYVCCPVNKQQDQQRQQQSRRVVEEIVVVEEKPDKSELNIKEIIVIEGPESERQHQQSLKADNKPELSVWRFGGSAYHEAHRNAHHGQAGGYPAQQNRPQSYPARQPSNGGGGGGGYGNSGPGPRQIQNPLAGAAFPISFRPMQRARPIGLDEKIIKYVYVPAGPAGYGQPRPAPTYGLQPTGPMARYGAAPNVYRPANSYSPETTRRPVYTTPRFGYTTPPSNVVNQPDTPAPAATPAHAYATTRSAPASTYAPRPSPAPPLGTTTNAPVPTGQVTTGATTIGRTPVYPTAQPGAYDSALLAHIRQGYPYNDLYYYPGQTQPSTDADGNIVVQMGSAPNRGGYAGR